MARGGVRMRREASSPTEEILMRKLSVSAATVLALGALATGAAWAGQPNASCETDNPSNPPPGFSTGGFDTGAANYAGSDGTHSQQNAQSGAAVSQYDVACTTGRTK